MFQNIIYFSIEVSSAVDISTFTFVTETTFFGLCALIFVYERNQQIFSNCNVTW